MSRNRSCVFPGTFDPFTVGHLDIARRAAKLFDRVTVAVSASQAKGCMFSLEDRVAFAQAACADCGNVTVEGFDDLLVDFLRRTGCKTVVRGLRTVADLEYESALTTVYRIQDAEVESVFLLNDGAYAHVHGNIVRDLLRHGADVAPFVPPAVYALLTAKK